MSAKNKPLDDVQEKSAMYRKVKVKFAEILHKLKFCALCLEDSRNFMDLDDFTVFSYWEGSFMVTIHDILKTIFGEKLPLTLCSEQLCHSCVTKLRDSYFFILNTQRTAEIINDCVDQMNKGFDETEKTLKSGVAFDKFVKNLNDPVDHHKKFEIGNNGFVIRYYEDETEPQEKVTITFSCNRCNVQFNSKEKFFSHIRLDHKKDPPALKVPNEIEIDQSELPMKTNLITTSTLGQKQIKCPQCKIISCVHKKYIMSWYRQRKDNILSLIKCVDCDFECANRGLLLAHVNEEHLKKLTCTCEQCGAVYETRKALRAHVRSSHTVWLSCKYCSFKFNDQSKLNEHENDCSKVKRPYQCSECPASFDSNPKLIHHKKRHGTLYPCKLCVKSYPDKKTLAKHERTHFEKTSRSFICAYCNATFKTLALKRSHEKSEHPTDKPKCLVCEMEFPSIEYYSLHQTSLQHKKKLNPLVCNGIKCQQCDYTTRTDELLESHVNKCHLMIKPYECSVCQSKFTGARCLRRHMTVHNDPKKQCQICGMYIRGPAALKLHMRSHTQ